MDKLKEERGELVIESTYCIIISLFVLMVLVAFAFLLYQRTVFTAVSHQIAEQMVQIYKYTRTDLTAPEYVQQSDVVQVGLYRYLLKKDEMQNICEARVQNALTLRMSATSFARQSGYTVKIEPVSDDVFGRRHFRVEIKTSYGLLLGGFLDAVGLRDAGEMTAVVYVEGYDIQAHENTLVTTKYMMDTVTDNKAGKTATAIFGTIKSCLNLLKTLFG